MKLQTFCRRIGLQPEIISRLELAKEEMDLASLEIHVQNFMNKETAKDTYEYLKGLFQEDTDHICMLYCQLECARRVAVRCQRMGIPEKIYLDTMKCFPRFLEECKEKNGRLFFDRGWWTYRQISMQLFRIGALEYEFKTYQGFPVIALHIPSDADLSFQAVDHSLSEAGRFFRAFYPDYHYELYTCDSWLLAPALRPFLASGSHILAFQNRFQILHVETENLEYLEWLFQVPKDTPIGHLPERTCLQRQVKEAMQKGAKIGSAFGIMKREKDKSE